MASETQSALAVIRSEVRALRAYALKPDRAGLKMNQNESPWDPGAELKAEVIAHMSARKWSRYADFVPTELNQSLAAFAGWTSAGVLAGNGSNELIQALLMVTMAPGKSLLICEPTFALYRQVATVLGGSVISVPLTDSLQFNADAILQNIAQHKPEVTVLCSPNNPTGSLLSVADANRIADASQGIVAIDEAYADFAGANLTALLEGHTNLVLLRTFSKAMALAALRVGYLLGAPALVTEIRKAVLPYNLNAFSQVAALVSISRYESEIAPNVRAIIAERERVFGQLSNIDGLVAVPSRANFILIRSRIEPALVCAALLERDILVRDVSSYPMLRDCFRVSVGTAAENDALLLALAAIFS